MPAERRGCGDAGARDRNRSCAGRRASSVTAAIIPDKAVVMGVSGRVTAAVTGATGWSLGVPHGHGSLRTGYGIAQNSFAHGVSGQPQAYFGGTALEITAEGGSFTAAPIRLAGALPGDISAYRSLGQSTSVASVIDRTSSIVTSGASSTTLSPPSTTSKTQDW